MRASAFALLLLASCHMNIPRTGDDGEPAPIEEVEPPPGVVPLRGAIPGLELQVRSAKGASALVRALAPFTASSELVKHGFGLTTTKMLLTAVKETCVLRVVSFRDELARIETSCDLVLGEGWGVTKKVDTLVRWDRAGVLDRARAWREHALGGPPLPIAIPPRLVDAYTMVTVTPDAVGGNCGIDAQPPRGLVGMNALVAARRADLLRNALRGKSAEGRFYGARGLRMLGSLTKEDEAAIAAVEADDADLTTCNGCIVYGPMLPNPLDYDRLE